MRRATWMSLAGSTTVLMMSAWAALLVSACVAAPTSKVASTPAPVYATEAPTPPWDYASVDDRIGEAAFKKKLEEYGDAGWELVAVIRETTSSGDYNVYWLKRRKGAPYPTATGARALE